MPTPAGSGTHSLLFDVYVLGQRIRQLLAANLGSERLRPEEYAVYSVVFEEEAVSPTAMAGVLSMPLTTVVDYVRQMESRGHGRRVPNPRDGRSYLVVLTAAGRRAHRETNLQFERVYRRFLEALPQGERLARTQLGQLLGAAQYTLESLAAEPLPPAGLLPTGRARGR
jgi:DNA-binding MarR family transcriptional regulator